jgi:putative endonuclease
MNLEHNKRLGQSGEDSASNFLLSNGYKIITRNFHSAYGEIDIIALKEDTIVFIEVKSRSSNTEAAQNAVSVSKQTKLKNTASIFLSQHPNYEQFPTRFDVISIIYKNHDQQLNHLKDAF